MISKAEMSLKKSDKDQDQMNVKYVSHIKLLY